MVCPLCKAEFREGFTQCNDCKLDLVGKAEAERIPVVRIWKGWYQPKAEKLACALADEGVPCRLNVDIRYPEVSLWTLLRGYRKELVVEIFVLGSDEARARQVVSHGAQKPT
jgi:hypothetical protein